VGKFTGTESAVEKTGGASRNMMFVVVVVPDPLKLDVVTIVFSPYFSASKLPSFSRFSCYVNRFFLPLTLFK
jgi:hypothetical protein